jgi:copper chaperone
MMTFKVEGMTCGGCARAVTNAVKGVDPEAEVAADVPGRTVTVASRADQARIVAALAEAGYTAQPAA